MLGCGTIPKEDNRVSELMGTSACGYLCLDKYKVKIYCTKIRIKLTSYTLNGV
jgi:hypothetical protein